MIGQGQIGLDEDQSIDSPKEKYGVGKQTEQTIINDCCIDLSHKKTYLNILKIKKYNHQHNSFIIIYNKVGVPVGDTKHKIVKIIIGSVKPQFLWLFGAPASQSQSVDVFSFDLDCDRLFLL